MNAYGFRARKISPKCEALFGELLVCLEAQHHVAKLPKDECEHEGYARGSVRARTLAMFEDDIKITSSDVASHFGISRKYAWGLLQQLFDDGYIRIDGIKPKRGSPPAKAYTRAEAA